MAIEAPELAEAAAAGAARGSASAPPAPSKPDLNDDQSVTWELFLVLGIVLLLISPIGKWLGGIVQEITTHHDVTLNWNPFAQSSSSSGTASTPASSGSSGGGGGSNAAVGHYTVNLAGGGQMTVNASSPQAAVENVSAEGGKPA